MNESVVQALLEYLEEDTIGISLTEDEFEKVCYSRWAASELVDAILDHPKESSEDVVFDFVMKMTACGIISGEKPSGKIFEIAADFALDCLETLF